MSAEKDLSKDRNFRYYVGLMKAKDDLGKSVNPISFAPGYDVMFGKVSDVVGKKYDETKDYEAEYLALRDYAQDEADKASAEEVEDSYLGADAALWTNVELTVD